MSSDESTSTQLSTFSNRGENKEKLKPHKPEPWEINLIANFLLDLYHRSLIGRNDDWCIKKFIMRIEYSKFITKELSNKLKDLNGTDDIGTMLHRCNFLINTPKELKIFKINSLPLFEYRKCKLNELDDIKINNDKIEQQQPIVNDRGSENMLMNLLQNNSNILNDVDENFEKILLEYQCTDSLKRKENYVATDLSCCICQEDFSTRVDYESHIQKHGEETDFQFLKTMIKLPTPFLKISYSLRKDSHYFCFEIEMETLNLIFEKIIIVQSNSFYYVNNNKRLTNGKHRFYVDSHLFTIDAEQPIVFIFHRKGTKEVRIIEQHHIMRSAHLPNVQLSNNLYRLPNDRTFEQKIRLNDFYIPEEIQNALKDNLYYEKLMEISTGFRDYVCNGKKLKPDNLSETINILLQIEDMDTMLQYLCLTKKSIKLRSFGDFYSFRLKPKQSIFIENILSADDELILTTRTDMKDEDILKLMMKTKNDIKLMTNTYVGKIHAINMGLICFRCDRQINLQSQYTVICRPSRLNLRFQYRSLELLPYFGTIILKYFLFPAKIIPRPVLTLDIELYNSNINDEQLQAVRNIYVGIRNDAPYIIFGPPGTGKTTTLVESILQLLRKSYTKILVTAPSDGACDEIAKRLCKYLKYVGNKRAMVRIYSHTSKIRKETIDKELLENSNIYNEQFYPDVDTLHQYSIVVCTLSVVGFLATGYFGRSKAMYSHLIIDDCTAITEAETLIGITTVLTSKSCLIISGDSKQLEPKLKSQRAKEFGLGVSLMERLMLRDCYRVNVDTGDYDRSIQTRLTRNHRSHPAIVNMFSGLYYNHSVEAHANKDDVSLCEMWHKSRNRQFPIMFHAIYEPSRADNQSHSLYNISELNVVMDYVKDLMYFGINGKPVKESDIGIISPYKKQFKRIQEELNLRKWFGIETGSVETFQGKEKNIIIVSFVRSATGNLDILDNARHLNVIISRPKSFLILIGNPKTLSLNSDFEYIIKECKRNNTFVDTNASTKNVELKKQVSEKLAKSQEHLTVLNKGLSELKLDSMCLNKDIKKGNNANKRETRSNVRSNRNVKNISNKNNTNEKLKGNKNERNIKKEESSDDDDDDENESDSDSDDDDDKPTTSFAIKNKTKSNKTSKKGKNKQELKNKTTTSKVGKITKQYDKGKQRNVLDNKQDLNKSKIDSFLDDLPKVPSTNVNFSNPKFFEMQEESQAYKNDTQQKQEAPATHMQQQNQFHYNLQQQQQPFNNILQQQPAFNAFNPYYNQTSGNLPPFGQTIATQIHHPPVIYTPHPQPIPYLYATASPLHINGLMHAGIPNASINNVMTTDANLSAPRTENKNNEKSKSEKRNQNRNVINNKNKGSKSSKAAVNKK